jgi:methyl-accepting chemotaxis protein
MKWYNNMKIGVKLIVGFLLVALIAGIVGVMGIMNINKINELDQRMYETMTVPLGEMVLYVEALEGAYGDATDVLFTTDQGRIEYLENKIKEKNAIFKTNLESFGKTLLTEEGQQLTNEIFELKERLDNIISEVIKLAKENRHDEAVSLLTSNESKDIKDRIQEAINRMAVIKEEAAQNTVESNMATANSAVVETIVAIIIGMGLSIFLGIFIASSINKPLNKLVNVSEKMAEGDLDVIIDIERKDELGVLAESFRKMSDKLNEEINNISTAAEQVAAGAKQVSDSSMTLSQGAAEQASTIEELTASLEEVSEQTQLNAQHANNANELAEEAKINAESGNMQMQQTLNAMEEINNASANISKIIKVIDEIAFQTNILALNAAVEAARAGQHGKGFAVVAEEVRNLAARSANAAKETTELIEGSIKKAEDGTKIAKETAEALNKIVEAASKVASLVNNIAHASNEQANAIAQINQGILQVSQVVQTNSATSEEGAAASEELSSQAELLRQSVSKFKLRKTKYFSKSPEFTPEILKMLEEMSESKKGNTFKETAAINNSQPKISLEEQVHDKY